MAIATATNLYTSYSPITTKTRNYKSVSIPLQPGAYISRHVKFAVPIQKRTTLSISAASTTAIQVDGPTTSSKASKTLPFRVGHGFDLHRLEPGYPLIIGGIDVPHDRGCEAHSDGNILIDS
jgi:2-C-methyl-D-erythritol 2,4-cyclodiphosphate synthase